MIHLTIKYYIFYHTEKQKVLDMYGVHTDREFNGVAA